jgi:hypothetical protein
MILEMLVGAGVVALGAATVRVIMRRRAANAEAANGGEKKAEKQPEKKPEKKKEETKKKAKGKEKEKESSGPRGLRVGDVLLYADSELWLAGMIQLDEEGLACRVFPTPGGLRSSWVVQLDDQGRDLGLMSDTDDVPAGPVPESLPMNGRRLTLERRGHAEVRGEGEHVPSTSGRCAYAILSDAGGRVLVVVDFEKAPRLAILGDRVSPGVIDLLPGGDLEKED